MRRARRRNPDRVTIRDGELLAGYEPHDMPGAFVDMRFRVVDSTGQVPSNDIRWSGPATWRDSRDGVPAGYRGLWLGTRDTTRPFVVFVSDKPTPWSDAYYKAYRRGYFAKRRPVVTDKMARVTIDGVMDGWKANPSNPYPGHVRKPLSW